MKMLRKEMALLLTAALLLQLFAAASAQAVSATTATILLYLNESKAYVNKDEVQLDAPATVIDGSTYVPAKFLGDTLGFDVKWDAATNTIAMKPQGYNIVLDSPNKKITINGVETTFAPYAAIVNGKLLVKLTWVADYMGATYTYNDELKRVQITYVKAPPGVAIDAYSNKPVAKFTFGKKEYRIGEPVKYVDLSYSPDAQGIANYEWIGKQEAFFTPGTYSITLIVTDSKGHKSAPFTNYVKVSDKVYLSEFEYPLYMKPVGSTFRSDWSMYYSHFSDLPEVPKTVTEDKSRKLLLSDSPEEIKQQGILYQDEVNGKARLYSDHINGTDSPLSMAVLATNKTDKPVVIKTTNRGEVYPSVYAQLIGNEASVDFLMNMSEETTLTVPPKQTVVYTQLPTMYPRQGVNLFYDIETDGPVDITFAAADKITPDSVLTLPRQSYVGNVRGTFPVSGLRWDIDGAALSKPSRLILGDGKSDPFVDGVDVFRSLAIKNEGNYGVKYDIHISNPKKMVVMIMGRGGGFKGPFKINGDFQLVPWSGVLPAFKEVQLLARTTGDEPSLDIEYTPPAGTGFPADLIFYPLPNVD
ncbi:copper amine oxidase [Gordoniibacillus kamchatkensis]|uniref:Copper amine oxidase n=1 Tax=Gordoniibacillus kamchatkensis TaxID=1590651 RepID=A0ABR5ACV6_9BACL|nr:copper amine oxidase N-terminal domain-containing protein [Paenibacillus sp. VKM B-2647]KIL38837.1 copper amine oxidase [Paenibacillus sp. VKM B-2647]